MAQVVVFEGPLDTLSVDTAAADKAFTGDCLDGWSRPGGSKLSTPVYQGKRTGDLVGVILDAIGWPATARSLDPGATVVPYWWADGTDAATAVADLVHSEGPPAIAYVRNGVFTFRDRHHRVTITDSLTPQGTYTHIIPSGPVGTDHKILKNSFTYDHGLDYIVNSASIEVTPRVPQAVQVVWKTEDSIALGPNQSVTLVIRTDDPFIQLTVPSPAITYWDDDVLTADYTLTQGTVSFGLSRTSGQSAYLTVTAGGTGCVIPRGVKVRGVPLSGGATRIYSATDPVSQATYGSADWDGAAPWAHFYDADAITAHVVGIYSQPRPSITFDVEGRLSTGTLTRILATDVSDRITVRNDEIGLTADFHVEQVTHAVVSMGVKHRQTIGAQVVEPYQSANPLTFGVTGQGFGQGQFSLSAGLNPATMFRFDTAAPTTQGFGAGVFAT